MLLPFAPGVTTSLSATTSTGQASLTGGTNQLRLFNAGTVTVFVTFGANPTAAVTDFPIPPGVVEVITRNTSDTKIAGITATGTATLYCTVGAGQ